MIKLFKLDLARAITEQLVEQFYSISPSLLTSDSLQLAKTEPGVYQLFFNDELVYVGKSDKNLFSRLDRHRKTLTGRKNLSIEQISFKGIHLDKNWSTLTTEAQLISHFGDTPWNNSGFGSNDPGRNRDHSELKSEHFDILYPIDVAYVPQVDVGKYLATEILSHLKTELPYLLRYDKAIENVEIEIERKGMSTSELIVLIASRLAGDWQATALPGRILLYPETNISYPSAVVLWPIN